MATTAGNISLSPRGSSLPPAGPIFLLRSPWIVSNGGIKKNGLATRPMLEHVVSRASLLRQAVLLLRHVRGLIVWDLKSLEPHLYWGDVQISQRYD